MPWVTYTRDISVGCIRLPSRCCLSNISGIALGIMIKLVPVCTTSGIVPLEVVQKIVRESECSKKQQQKNTATRIVAGSNSSSTIRVQTQ